MMIVGDWRSADRAGLCGERVFLMVQKGNAYA